MLPKKTENPIACGQQFSKPLHSCVNTCFMKENSRAEKKKLERDFASLFEAFLERNVQTPAVMSMSKVKHLLSNMLTTIQVKAQKLFAEKGGKQTVIVSVPDPQLVCLPPLCPPHPRAPKVGRSALTRVRYLWTKENSSSTASCMDKNLVTSSNCNAGRKKSTLRKPDRLAKS